MGHQSKLFDKNHLHNRTEAFTSQLKQPSLTNEAKAFVYISDGNKSETIIENNKQFRNLLAYSTNKINRHINHTTKELFHQKNMTYHYISVISHLK